MFSQMSVHDWTRVDAGTFHAFHMGWITHLSEVLNGGLLPSGYYAMSEQHGGHFIADVLTLLPNRTFCRPEKAAWQLPKRRRAWAES